MSEPLVPLLGFEAIDWDEEDDPDGNLAHCLRHGVDECTVDEILGGSPVQIKMKLQSAEYSIVGPDRTGRFWTILFDTSFKRGDWLRPITGWRSTPRQIKEWRRAKGIENG